MPNGPGLSESLAERAASARCSFHVAMLARPIAFSAALGSAGDPASGFVAFPDVTAAREHDRQQSSAALAAWLDRFCRLGFDADGEVHEIGAVDAVARTVAVRGAFTEILLADRRRPVLQAIAGFVGCDVARRVQRRVHLPASLVQL